MKLGMPSSEHQDPLLALEEGQELIRHQRVDHVQHQHRDAALPVGVGHAQQLERAQRGRGEPALQDDAEPLLLAGPHLVEPALDDVALRGGEAALELLGLLGVGRRRVTQAAVVERVALERGVHADRRAHVVPADHAPAHVRRAYT
jgi:hypothetical protein